MAALRAARLDKAMMAAKMRAAAPRAAAAAKAGPKLALRVAVWVIAPATEGGARASCGGT